MPRRRGEDHVERRAGRIEILEALVDDRDARKLRHVSARDSGEIRPRLDAHDAASAPRQGARRLPGPAADLQNSRPVGRHLGERKKIVEELLGIAATRSVVKIRDVVEGLSPQDPSFLIHGEFTCFNDALSACPLEARAKRTSTCERRTGSLIRNCQDGDAYLKR